MRKLSADVQLDRAVKLLNQGKSVNQFPQDLKDMVERWNFAAESMNRHQGKPRRFIIELLKLRYPGLSNFTYHQDINNAMALFARVSKPNLEFERIVAIERIKKNIERAVLNEDFRSAAALERALAEYLNRVDDSEGVDPEDYQVNTIITFDPELLGIKPLSDKIIKETIREAHRSKIQRMEGLAEDANYEEMKDE